MKVKSLKVLLTTCLAALSIGVFAQVDYNQAAFAKYGKDATEREQNFKAYSFFNEEYASKNYPMATLHLKQLTQSIPAVHQNLYIKGLMIYNNLISTAKTAEQKKTYIDSLMILHNLRMENYGNDAKRGKPYIMGEILKDYLNYYQDDHKKIIDMVDKTLKEVGPKIDVEILPAYFNYLVEAYKADKIDTEIVLSEYDKLSTTADASTSPAKDGAKSTIDQLLMQSGAASCENLEQIFKPQYEANPNDKELISKIIRTLARAQCSSDFQLMLAEKHYSIDPSSSAAANLAYAFEKKGEFDKAIQYYNEAINKEPDNKNKVSFALSGAGMAVVNSRLSDAVKFARKALEINSEEGLAYFLLAQAQAQSVGGCGAFEKQAAFWVVVDNLQRARNLVSGDYLQKVNESIANFSRYFPTAEEIFFNDLKPGSSYTVNCGAVSGTTTIRAKR
ncbi:MAG: hypothetical protein RR277_02135 [Rikenellaceae bacterium]